MVTTKDDDGPIDADAAARKILSDFREDYLEELFKDTELVHKKSAIGSTVGLLTRQAGAVMGAAGAAAGGASGTFVSELAEKVLEALMDVLPGMIGAVFTELGQHVTEQILNAIASAMSVLGAAAPGLGIVTSLGAIGKSAIPMLKDAHRRYQLRNVREGLADGDPAAAFTAVQRILRRDFHQHAISAVHTVGGHTWGIAGNVLLVVEAVGAIPSLGASAVFVPVTAFAGALGPLASAFAQLIQTLFVYGRNWKEMRRGNERLKDPATLDLTLFEDCPILGCYYLTCADTGTIVNMSYEEMGDAGWMDKVEQLEETALKPLLFRASRIIDEHSYRLKGIDGDVEANIRMISKGRVLRGDKPWHKFARKKAGFKRTLKRQGARKAKAMFARFKSRVQ